MSVKFPHDCWILVGDGRKAMLMRNEGDEVYPNFQVERLMEQENPPTREQGTDAPGSYRVGGGTPGSTFEQTDWHDLEEHRFAETVADRLDRLHQQGRFGKLVIVAPPTILGTLRKRMSKTLQKTVIAEIDKDYTNHPVPEIERLLTA